MNKQARKGFRPPSAMKGIGYFQNLRKNFLTIFLEIFVFWKFFSRIFFEEFFFGRIFWKKLLREIFWEDFFLGGGTVWDRVPKEDAANFESDTFL